MAKKVSILGVDLPAIPDKDDISQQIRDEASGKSLSFDTQQDLIDWIASGVTPHQGFLPSDLQVGQNIYIVDETSPDYWVKTTPVDNINDLGTLSSEEAVNIRFNGSGTNYLVSKTDVESAVKELDTQVALKVSTSNIVDNLNSTDTNKPLSANQGKELEVRTVFKEDLIEFENFNIVLPNRIKDSIEQENGKHYYVKRVGKYQIKNEDIEGIITADFTNFEIVYAVVNLLGISTPNTSFSTYGGYIDTFTPSDNVLNNKGNFLAGGRIRFTFPKGTSLTDAKNILTQSYIYYPLAVEVKYEIPAITSSIINYDDYKIVEVGVGKKYTSILKAFKDNEFNKIKVLVYDGVYDLESEYVNYYGVNFFNNYAGYSNMLDRFTRGLNLKDGDQIIGIGNVEITFPYTGINLLVKEFFAPINTSQNNLVKDLKITIAEDSCRYGIHDDFAYGEGNNIFSGCTFFGKSYLNTFMGSGFGKSNNYLIEDCLFYDAGDLNIAYHSNISTENKCRIIIKNSKGNGNVRFNAIGTSTDVAVAVVNNNEFNDIFKIQDGAIDNIELVMWDNVILDHENWTTPTLYNGFDNLDPSFGSVGFMLDRSGFVHIKGVIISSTTGNLQITNMPSGFRPENSMIFSTISNGNLIRVDVDFGGEVVVYNYVGGYLSLNITYKARN